MIFMPVVVARLLIPIALTYSYVGMENRKWRL